MTPLLQSPGSHGRHRPAANPTAVNSGVQSLRSAVAAGEDSGPIAAAGTGRRIKIRYVLLLLVLALGILFSGPIVTNAKVALLLSQEFSLPVKPLNLVTRAPEHRKVILSSPHGPVVADIVVPQHWLGTPGAHSTPALILAFGVKVPPSARKDVLRLADALARLGYVTVWPRLRGLDRGQSRIEEPSTFLSAITFLRSVRSVDSRRISFLGISVGASIAFVAASDPRVARSVRSLVFFGGYYDMAGYLTSLITHQDRFGGHTVRWSPSPDAVSQVKSVLRRSGEWDLQRLFRAKTPAEARRLLASVDPKHLAALRRFSPAAHLGGFHARIFILHDRGDRYVPYVESEKLNRALPPGIDRTVLISNVFQHVEPGGGSLPGLLQLYRFVYGAMASL